MVTSDDQNQFYANWILKTSSAFHAVEGYKYVIKIGDRTKTTALSILRSVDSGPLNKNWLLRFDNPHRGVNYGHLNVRHKYTGVQDPHLWLPPGSLTVAKSGGYLCKILDFVRRFTLVYDTYRLMIAVRKDYQNGTIHNSVECITDIIFPWVGGFIGGSVGGLIGTLVLPGVGSLIGAFAGSVTGVFYGHLFATKLIYALKLEEVHVIIPSKPFDPISHFHVNHFYQ